MDTVPLEYLLMTHRLATALARHLDAHGDSDANAVWQEAHALEADIRERRVEMERFAPLDAVQESLAFRGRIEAREMAGVR